MKAGKPLTFYEAAEAEPSIKPERRKLATGVLAQINHHQNITACVAGYDTPKTLITIIKVRAHPSHASVKEFYAEFFLKDKVDAKWPVGSLHAQTVDRQTRGISKPLYLTELLGWDLKRPLYHAHESEPEVDETQIIMRHIFDHTGAPRSEYSQRPLLNANLHFIAEFEISDEYRGPGLAQLAMKAYHEAVQELSGGYAFQGTVVLSPAALRGAFDAKAGAGNLAKSYVEIEHALIASYGKSGYKVWSKADDALEGSGITIMGKTIGELEQHQQDLAPAAVFPPFVKVDHHAPAKDGQSILATGKREKRGVKKPRSKGDARKKSGVKPETCSRKSKALKEALDDMESRYAKLRLYSPPEREQLRECQLKDWDFKCKHCALVGAGRWHAWDCDVWTADWTG